MRNQLFSRIFASILLLTFILTAAAQDDSGDEGVAMVIRVTPKSGAGPDLEKAITAYHKWQAGNEGAMRYQWYSILSGPDTGSYIARTGNHDWADFDASHDWDEEADMKFAAEVEPYIEEVQIWYTSEEKGWGSMPENIREFALFNITYWYVRSGMTADFRAGFSTIDSALKKGGFPRHYSMARVVSGGQGEQMVLVRPLRNFADLSPFSPSFMEVMTKSMGSEAKVRSFLKDWGPTYKPGESFLIRYEPGLSDYGD
jgi:hypothetical protein